jgi:hypothetical protein
LSFSSIYGYYLQQRQWAYVDCQQQSFGGSNYGQQNYGQALPRPVCKKMKQLGKKN